MSELNTNVLKDGQLAVATVEQSGTVVSEPSEVNATVLVQTDNGKQLCVPTFEMGEGGGGGGTDGANKDLSNLSNTGNAMGAHLSFPSEVSENLTPVKSKLYTAPADGFVYAGNNTNGSGSSFRMTIFVCTSDTTDVDHRTDILACREDGGTTGDAKHVVAPISKGQKFCVFANCNLDFLKFVYANGGTANPGTGGTGGVIDYITQTTNKPSINSITLSGDKTGSDLGLLENTATGNNSLTILGSSTTSSNSVNIGEGSLSTGNYTVGLGYNAKANATGAIAIGNCQAQKPYAISIGRNSYTNGNYAICIATAASTSNAYGDNSIQLGAGTNGNDKTLQVYEYQLLDGNTGKIPTDRMAKVITLTTTSVELASDNVYNGGELASVTLTLPATVPANFCCQVQFTSGATATTFSASGIFFEGDECAGGTFTPSANHRYSIMIYNDGVNTIGFVYEK